MQIKKWNKYSDLSTEDTRCTRNQVINATLGESGEAPRRHCLGWIFTSEFVLGIYSREMKVYIQTKTFTEIHMLKCWKQPKCPSVGEWTQKLWDIHKMECYLAIKKEHNYWYTQPEWTWKTLCRVEEARLKRPCTFIWHSWKDTTVVVNCSGCQGLWVGRVWFQRDSKRKFEGQCFIS